KEPLAHQDLYARFAGPARVRSSGMAKVVYKIVKHENGWAYKARGTFSEAFPTYDAALEAAKRAAGEQRVPGETVAIEYETKDGIWDEELDSGSDRPETNVED